MKGVFILKIHIVQRGDTLWDIADQYGVDFNELQAVNTHLSSPDMIMPGMKIKIPSQSKPVKEEKMQDKKTKKHVKEQPKPISPKPLALKEDDHKKPKEVKQKTPKFEQQAKEKMPQIPSVPPMMETPMYEQPMKAPMPKKEMPKEKPMKEKVKETKEVPKMPEMPEMEMPQIQHQHVPMSMCYHAMPSCCCKYYHQPMMPQCHCHEVGHQHHQPMPYHQQSYAPMSMQHQPTNEAYQQGFYDQPNVQENHTTQYSARSGQQNEHQMKPYPPLYRHPPQNPPNPTPPDFPAMSAHGTGENDSYNN